MANDITINNIYPWGRTFDEYRKMLALTEADLHVAILAGADGPADFNAHMRKLGHKVISCDPLYQFCAPEIRSRVAATAEEMVRKAQQNSHRFVWDQIKSPEHLSEVRLAATEIFLADYETGKREGRYITAQLPRLPFANQQFDLAICSHFLFLYEQQIELEFHLAAVLEMCRVAREVRIFPLLNMTGERSQQIEAAIKANQYCGLSATIEKVPYEFQRGGNEIMRIRMADAG